jgi:hypothetical protein
MSADVKSSYHCEENEEYLKLHKEKISKRSKCLKETRRSKENTLI